MRRAGSVWLVFFLLFCGCKRQPSDDTPAIHKAVSSGNLTQVRSLLAQGADPDARNRYGWTPLHVAVEQGHAAMVELLLKSGANPDADGPEGPPLHMAIVGGYAAVVRKLIDGGADVNVRDRRIGACTALQHALWGAPRVYREEVIEILLAAGADPRLSADGGGTVLHEAASEGLTRLADAFLAHGADVNAQDAMGSTPLHDAVWGNHLETATLLLYHGADINLADRVGDTPLHIAAVNGYAALFARLQDRRANLRARNDLGQTPLDCLRSPDEPNMVVLHADGQSPYEVIFTLPATVGGFLGGQGIEFDHVWTPSRNDIEGLDLEAAVKASDPVGTKSHISMEYILEHFTQYHREYAGFLRQGRRYLICNMYFASLDTPPRDGFTAGVMDAQCNLVTVVVDLETSRAVSIDCRYCIGHPLGPVRRVGPCPTRKVRQADQAPAHRILHGFPLVSTKGEKPPAASMWRQSAGRYCRIRVDRRFAGMSLSGEATGSCSVCRFARSVPGEYTVRMVSHCLRSPDEQGRLRRPRRTPR